MSSPSPAKRQRVDDTSHSCGVASPIVVLDDNNIPESLLHVKRIFSKCNLAAIEAILSCGACLGAWRRIADIRVLATLLLKRSVFQEAAYSPDYRDIGAGRHAAELQYRSNITKLFGLLNALGAIDPAYPVTITLCQLGTMSVDEADGVPITYWCLAGHRYTLLSLFLDIMPPPHVFPERTLVFFYNTNMDYWGENVSDAIAVLRRIYPDAGPAAMVAHAARRRYPSIFSLGFFFYAWIDRHTPRAERSRLALMDGAPPGWKPSWLSESAGKGLYNHLFEIRNGRFGLKHDDDEPLAGPHTCVAHPLSHTAADVATFSPDGDAVAAVLSADFPWPAFWCVACCLQLKAAPNNANLRHLLLRHPSRFEDVFAALSGNNAIGYAFMDTTDTVTVSPDAALSFPFPVKPDTKTAAGWRRCVPVAGSK